MREERASTMTLINDEDSTTACLLCRKASIALLPTMPINIKDRTEIRSTDNAKASKVMERGRFRGFNLFYPVMSQSTYDVTMI